MEQLRVCRLGVHGELGFPTIEHTPSAIQDALGGYFEPIGLPSALAAHGFLGLVDEDGLSKQLPPNKLSPLLGRLIVGQVLIVRADPPEFLTLTDGDCRTLRKWFG